MTAGFKYLKDCHNEGEQVLLQRTGHKAMVLNYSRVDSDEITRKIS